MRLVAGLDQLLAQLLAVGPDGLDLLAQAGQGLVGQFDLALDACEVLALAVNGERRWAGFLWLLAYWEVEQGLGFLRALCSLLLMQPRCSGGGGGGGGGRRRQGPKEEGLLQKSCGRRSFYGR